MGSLPTELSRVRWGWIPDGEEGKLREQFDCVTTLHQRLSP